MKFAASIVVWLFCTPTFGQSYPIFDQLLDQAYLFNGKVVQGKEDERWQVLLDSNY